MAVALNQSWASHETLGQLVSTADLDLTNAGGGDVQLEITSSITGQKLNLNTVSVQANNKAENGIGAVADEINRWTPIIKSAGLKLD